MMTDRQVSVGANEIMREIICIVRRKEFPNTSYEMSKTITQILASMVVLFFEMSIMHFHGHNCSF